MTFLLIGVVQLYKVVVSPFFPKSCRFEPSCSSYMIEAIQVHGAFKGAWLGLKRISRCHPLHQGHLYDPVPKKE